MFFKEMAFKNEWNIAFKKEALVNTFGEYISKKGFTQLRIAETEKYAHVTFFFNGGEEKQYKGEDRILVPSPKVETYDLKPEMSAYEVTDKVLEAIFILTLSALSGVWNPFNSLDNNLSDSMFQHKSERAKEIYIVGIDAHNLSPCMGIKILQRKPLHLLKEILP